MSKYKSLTEPIANTANLFGAGVETIDGIRYTTVILKRPATPAITKATGTGLGAWVQIASGLTGIRAWRLNHREGDLFRYRYITSGDYMTSFGASIDEDTEITDLYISTASGQIVELETWKN